MAIFKGDDTPMDDQPELDSQEDSVMEPVGCVQEGQRPERSGEMDSAKEPEVAGSAPRGDVQEGQRPERSGEDKVRKETVECSLKSNSPQHMKRSCSPTADKAARGLVRSEWLSHLRRAFIGLCPFMAEETLA